MEPQDLLEATEKKDDNDSLTNWVAVTIAILAVFMGLFKVKDDNIVQAMQQNQADRIDNWGWYQAHKTRVEVANATLATLKALPASPTRDEATADWQKVTTEQAKKADDTKAKAEAAEKSYDDWNYRDDQFDMSDSSLSVAIALLAVTALTKRRWLYFFSLIPTSFGLIMGLAGMFAWKIHPDALAKFLGT